MGSDVYGLPSRETYPDSQTWDLTLLIYELFFYPPNFSFPFFFFCRFSLEVSIIIPIFAPSLVGSLVGGGRSYIWERRFRTSVVVHLELRNFTATADRWQRDVYVVRFYIHIYIWFVLAWANCVVYPVRWGNAKACALRMGRRTDTYAFFVS